MKPVIDCLNSIEGMLLCNMEKNVGIGNLEDVRDSMMGMYNEKYIEQMMAMLAILSQINPIKDRFYLDNESDIEKQFCNLRKRILAWLDVCNAKPEISDQQQFF